MSNPYPFIRPRWVPVSFLSHYELLQVQLAESRRAKNSFAMKITRLRRELFAVDVCYDGQTGNLKLVKVALLRDHPRPDAFPAKARRFLTRKFRISQLLSGDYWVGYPALKACEEMDAA